MDDVNDLTVEEFEEKVAESKREILDGLLATANMSATRDLGALRTYAQVHGLLGSAMRHAGAELVGELVRELAQATDEPRSSILGRLRMRAMDRTDE